MFHNSNKSSLKLDMYHFDRITKIKIRRKKILRNCASQGQQNYSQKLCSQGNAVIRSGGSKNLKWTQVPLWVASYCK